ncbi:limb region 1 protein homolog isoform X1 [Lineus longissimus]|uniref:limb region 1 protein homolog isoform X1 n=1 Tax=Lineus longissimus TaxID=88925 RepID=UPI002B4EE3E3
MDTEADLREQLFHNAVREYIISLLLFILLYISSYATIVTFRRRADKEDYYSGDEEDAMVYRISLWICTFTLSVSLAAVLLLPISIVSNEVLIQFPKSYYVQWLNSSLIHGLWNNVFLCSNLALFILMPFAYFFTESEGFTGSRKGIMARVYETFVVLSLLAVLVFGLAWVASALIDEDHPSRQTLFGWHYYDNDNENDMTCPAVESSQSHSYDVWNVYLPYLYSGISLFGVLMLLLCTPLGFATLFTVMGQLVTKPQFLRDIDEELYTTKFEEETLKRRLLHPLGQSLANGHTNSHDLQTRLAEVQKDRKELEKRRKASSIQRNLGYPLVMLLLLGLTGLSVLMVAQNIFELIVGFKSLPMGAKETVLGIASLSTFGPVGATLEIILILYLMLASIVGLYSISFMCSIRPVLHDTPMTKIIANCILILVLSSALPVLSRMLGITNFNLLGDFGRMDWLGNFYLILSYNLVFAVATALCLVKKFTSTVRKELIDRIASAFHSESRHSISINSLSMNGSTLLKED